MTVAGECVLGGGPMPGTENMCRVEFKTGVDRPSHAHAALIRREKDAYVGQVGFTVQALTVASEEHVPPRVLVGLRRTAGERPQGAFGAVAGVHPVPSPKELQHD